MYIIVNRCIETDSVYAMHVMHWQSSLRFDFIFVFSLLRRLTCSVPGFCSSLLNFLYMDWNDLVYIV